MVAALDMAITQRRPTAVIHHSDQGCQYTAIEFGRRCREANVRPSMGSVGDCYDNAMCESFFATLECELLDRVTLRTPAEARTAVFDFIEGWYNPTRRHSSLDYVSPIAFERQARRRPRAAERHGGRGVTNGLWKLPDLWTHKTRPQLLGKPYAFSTAPTGPHHRYD